MLTRATQLVWWSWLTQSGLSMWVEWVHIYRKIPHKYIYGKQSVSGKVGDVAEKHSSPVSLLWYPCVWGWKANRTPRYWRWTLTCISVSLGSPCYCNCKAPKGMQEQPWRVTPQVHLTCTMVRWWSEAKVKVYRFRATLLQETSLLCPLDRQELSLYSTLEVASASKVTHTLQ